MNEMEQWEIINPEILSPAGSFQVLKAAIQAGCDAVYVGGRCFGARAFADNFSDEELLDAISYAHQHDCRLYLTVNTLLKEMEIEEQLLSYLLPFYEAGLDAVIVQDMGVLKKISEAYPMLPVHISTQAGIMSSEGAKLMQQSGAVRVVPARELNLQEIREITSVSGLEVECFVHGALCYGYSGHCQLSSSVGNRSGNRGRCAQPCRLPYELSSANNQKYNRIYALSPKDLCTIEILPELVASGITSFKIEGRMKKEEYVMTVTYLYKKYKDFARQCLLEVLKECNMSSVKELFAASLQKQNDFWKKVYLKYKVSSQELLLLQQMYNRGGFTTGYYHSKNGPEMMSMNRPNHNGVYLGKVEQIKNGTISFTSRRDLYPKDVLEIRMQDDRIELTSPIEEKSGKKVILNASKLKKIKPGQEIYRMKSPYLIAQMEEDIKKQKKEWGVTGKLLIRAGKNMEFTVTLCASSKITVTIVGDMAQQALKNTTPLEKIETAVKQTGGSGYCFSKLIIDKEEGCFVPLKAVKEMRRKALEDITEKRLQSFKRKISEEDQKFSLSKEREPLTKEIEWAVTICSLEQWAVATLQSHITAIYVDSALLFQTAFQNALSDYHGNAEIYLVLPEMFRPDTRDKIKTQLECTQFQGFVVPSIDAFAWVISYTEKKREHYKLVLDGALYSFNHDAVEYYQKQIQTSDYLTLDAVTCAAEETLNEIGKAHLPKLQLPVYGHRVIMTSTQCVIKNVKQCTGNYESMVLKDRMGKEYMVLSNCSLCYNQLLENEVVSMLGRKQEIMALTPKRLRLDFTTEKQNVMKKIITSFLNEYEDKEISMRIPGNTGHYDKMVE